MKTTPAMVALCFLFAAPMATAIDLPYRLTEIAHDYDNNGTPDATTTLHYNAAGEPTLVEYRYVDDLTPDLFNTGDNDASSEDTVFGFDANGLVTSSLLDRTNFDASTEQFDVVQTFTTGELARADFDTSAGGITGSTYATFGYVSGDLDQVVERMSSDDSVTYSLGLQYGGDGLPSVVTLTSPPVPPFFPGLDVVTTYSWRGDGQADSVSSVWTQGATVVGDGAGDYIYDAAGRRTDEVFTVVSGQGAFPAEFPGVNYRKTLDYDALGLLSREEFDLDDNASIEATNTATWEQGDCTPIFLWAPNGRPEFVEMPGTPYVQGTGWQSLRNCPEPAQGLSLLVGTTALAGFTRRRSRSS